MTRLIPPLDPDPLEVPPEPVRRNVDEPRSGGVIVWIAVAIVVGFVLAVVFLAAPRSASSVSPRSALTGAPLSPTAPVGRELPGGPLSGAPRSAIGSVLLGGKATWYDDGPGHYAAAGPVLREALGGDPAFRGERVTVCSDDACVTVRLIDWCACGDRGGVPTLLDLSADAFDELAPLGRGVIPVTIELAGSVPTLPPTDAGPTTSNGG
jgi:hypothetical protein